MNTYDWFRKRVYKLDQRNHDPRNKRKAYEKAMETETGVGQDTYRAVLQGGEANLQRSGHDAKERAACKAALATKEQVQEILKEYL